MAEPGRFFVCPSCGAPDQVSGEDCASCGQSATPLLTIGPGFVVASRYQLRKLLGRGGMGIVYQAHDRLLDETVAIKLLRPEVAASPEVAHRFRAEIKLARAVSHKNVCRIHEYGEDGGLRFISMAYVDGVDLKHVLRQRGPLPADEAFEILLRVAEGLQAIHDEGIIHRDLKTPNIMLDGLGHVRLMDFGIAKAGASQGTSVTVTGQIIGTPEYMSPEQVQAIALDARSDLYSLGIVAFELFTGVTPFKADTPVATMFNHINQPPPLDGPLAARLPPPAVPVLRRALAKRREERFASATELADALRLARDDAAAGRNAHETARTLPAQPAAPTSILASPTLASTDTPIRFASRGRLRIIVALVAGGLGTVWLLRPGPSQERTSESPAAPVASAARAKPSPSPSPTPIATPAATAETTLAEAIASLRRAPPKPKLPPPAPEPTPARQAAANGDATPGAVDTAQPTAASDAITRTLAEAGEALRAESFDLAIARYDEALRLEPQNAVAQIGRLAALNARAGAAARRKEPEHGFVAEPSVGESAETRPDTAFENAFEKTPGVEVTRDSQPSSLPGRIVFEVEPRAARPGDRFTLRILLVNAGSAPIQVRGLRVTTIVNGRRAGGSVPPRASQVAPGQSAPVLATEDFLRPDVESWSLEATVVTSRGETYRSRLTWH